MRINKTSKIQIEPPGKVFDLKLNSEKIFFLTDGSILLTMIGEKELLTDFYINGSETVDISYKGNVKVIVKTEQTVSLIISTAK